MYEFNNRKLKVEWQRRISNFFAYDVERGMRDQLPEQANLCIGELCHQIVNEIPQPENIQVNAPIFIFFNLQVQFISYYQNLLTFSSTW